MPDTIEVVASSLLRLFATPASFNSPRPVAEQLTNFEWPEEVRRRYIQRAHDLRRDRENTWAPEHHDRIVWDIHDEMDIPEWQVRSCLRADLHAPKRRGRPVLWPDALIKEAIYAWFSMYGRLPTGVDWNLSVLRERRLRRDGAERLDRFRRGWTDADGRRQGFPSRHPAMKRLVEEVDYELEAQNHIPETP